MLRLIQLGSLLKQSPSLCLKEAFKSSTSCQCHSTTQKRQQSRAFSSSTWNPNVLKSPLPDVELPKVSFNEFLWSRNDSWPNAVGLVCGVTGRQVTFKEVRRQSRRFARALLNHVELRPRQVLAVILPNALEFPPVVYGCHEANVIPTLISPHSTPDEISYFLKLSEAKVVVTNSEKLVDLEKAMGKDGSLKDLKIILTGTPRPDSGMFYFENLVKEETDEKLAPVSSDPEQTIVIPYSSGTTGLPKGVCLTNRNLLANQLAMEASEVQSVAKDGKQEVIPLILPLYHIYGLAILNLNWRCGSKTILLPKLEQESLLRSFTEHKGSVLYSATPLILYLLNNPAFGASELSSIHTIYNGASTLSASVMRRLIEKMKRPVHFGQAFGLTETSPLCLISRADLPDHHGSVGQPALNTQAKIVDLETKQALGSDEIGELCVKGPQVMKGYLKNEKETRDAIDSHGWYHTGDLSYYNQNNLFFITGRLKELIKVKGLQVSPAEVEGVLQSHTNISSAGVIGKPHDFHGETPVAFVVVKNEKEFNVEKLKEFLAEKLASYKIPSEIIPIKQMPVSNTGKILKRELKKLL